MSKPRLISFKLCPFVQRSVILLKEKGIDYDIEFIDVYDPPEWFKLLSPTGKVPVMVVEDTVLFESAVISEYIDEVYPPSLHPESPLEKAQNRAWVEFTSPLYMATFNIMMAKTQEELDTALAGLNSSLDTLEAAKQNQPWFNGENFSLVDIAASPFFVRAAFYKKHFDLDLLKDFPSLKQWSEKALARQTVIDSTVDGLEDMLLGRMKGNESFLQASA